MTSRRAEADLEDGTRAQRVRARKSLGQNFLVDGVVARQILDALPENPKALVEIGAGTGTMTKGLARAYGHVAAVELDSRLIPLLRHEVRALGNVQVVAGDALKVDIASLLPAPYAVFGNIPYYITGALIPRLLALAPGPEWIAVVVQLEVAQRLSAEPGGWSLATLAVRAFASAELMLRVPAHAFDPVPKVDSALLMLRPGPAATFADESFFDFARAVFQERRKKLPNAVANASAHDVDRGREVVRRAGIDEMRRPQTLDLEEWGSLYKSFQEARA
jgi:16S rRNA (adenine1518-N6/adenine1519-N6)-dimethyltransferase